MKVVVFGAALWAVGGHDAVRSRLRRETRQPRLCSEGTRNVLAAMDRHGVRRLVAVTSWGLGEAARRVPATYRLLIFPLLLRHENQDKQRQEELIRASQVDWTIVRPSRLTGRPRAATGWERGCRTRDRRDHHVSTVEGSSRRPGMPRHPTDRT